MRLLGAVLRVKLKIESTQGLSQAELVTETGSIALLAQLGLPNVLLLNFLLIIYCNWNGRR